MTAPTAATFFLSAAVVLGAAAIFGHLARRLGQPAVIGEVVAGIILALSVLPNSLAQHLVGPAVRPMLSALGNVGLALFLLLVGMELDVGLGKAGRRRVVGLAAGSLLVPLACGAVLATALAGSYAVHDRPTFILLVGVAMSVTALPVLARILAESGLTTDPVGVRTLGAAAVNDAVAWVCLAGAVGLARGSMQWRIALLPLYILLLLTAIRPVSRRLLRSHQAAALVPALLALLLASCAFTEWLGLHFIFGAFALGAALPKVDDPEVRALLLRRLRDAGGLLLPVYFVLAGIGVSVSALTGHGLAVLVGVILVATGSKIGGAYLGSRLTGADAGEALAAGVLMNTRGLTEIVVLSVGLDAGLIDPAFYSIMVVMALLTTAMTSPLTALLRRRVSARSRQRRLTALRSSPW